MKEKKFTFLQKLTMDAGRVVLSPLILVFRVKKYYMEGKCSREDIKNLKGAVITANHSGFSDPFILNASFWYRRFFYTASEEIMRGWRGKLLTGAGCIEIDRRIADFEAVKKCVNVLKQGYLLGIFPQGMISGRDPKGGAVLIAAMAKVPVVPAFIKHRKHWWQRKIVVFGKPVVIGEHCKKSMPDAKEIEAITGLLVNNGEMCREYLDRLGEK